MGFQLLYLTGQVLIPLLSILLSILIGEGKKLRKHDDSAELLATEGKNFSWKNFTHFSLRKLMNKRIEYSSLITSIQA